VTFDPKSNVYFFIATYGSNFVSISLDLTEISVFIEFSSLAGKS
jgi:hypothetical protein